MYVAIPYFIHKSWNMLSVDEPGTTNYCTDLGAIFNVSSGGLKEINPHTIHELHRFQNVTL